MKIAIIGAGNGGHAMAGHFSLLGHQVNLYNRSIEKIRILSIDNTIHLTDKLEATVKVNLVTDSLKEVIHGCELIMVTTTANAHKDIAIKLSPYLEDGQTIVLNPGRTFGAVEVKNVINSLTKRRIYVAEAQSLLYACRLTSESTIRVIGIKENVMVASYPKSDTEHVVSILHSIYPAFVPASSSLVTSLENIGAILHPPIVLFNAAAIERSNDFYFYNDMTPSIASFLEGFDAERLRIGHKLGLQLKSLAVWIDYAYGMSNEKNLCDRMRNNPAYYQIKAPTMLRSRLLLEDIPTGLVPFSDIAKKIGVATPLIDSTINLCSQLLNEDFMATGRTVKSCGLSFSSISEFIETL